MAEPTLYDRLFSQLGGETWNQYADNRYMTNLGRIGSQSSFKNQLTTAAIDPLTGLAGAGAAGSILGYGNLLGILAGQGKTDPAAMNREIAGINRGTQAQQGALQGGLAQRGMSRSGIGQALSQSIGQAGQDRVANRMAQETQMAEQRKRQDLELFMRMVMDPSIDLSAIAMGQPTKDKNQNTAAYIGALAQLIGAFV